MGHEFPWRKHCLVKCLGNLRLNKAKNASSLQGFSCLNMHMNRGALEVGQGTQDFLNLFGEGTPVLWSTLSD